MAGKLCLQFKPIFSQIGVIDLDDSWRGTNQEINGFGEATASRDFDPPHPSSPLTTQAGYRQHAYAGRGETSSG